MPVKYIPFAIAEQQAAVPRKFPTKFGIGIRTSPGQYGLKQGPFDTMEEALDIVPEDEDSFLLKLGHNQIAMWRWDKDGWVSIE